MKLRHLLPWMLSAALCVSAYTRNTTGAGFSGTPLFRTDNLNLQWRINTGFVAGVKNNDGTVVIKSGSNPTSAFQAALSQWAAIPTAKIGLAPLVSTSLSNDANDGASVVTIQDTPANRSAVGGALAITVYVYGDGGDIQDTDIIFNPTPSDGSGVLVPFSTDRSVKSYDLRSVATHELGHSFGSAHSGVIGATMFQSTLTVSSGLVTEATIGSRPSADDVAFITAAYPAPGAAAQFGRISGTVTLSGAPVRGGLVQATDAGAGVIVSALSSLNDGSFVIENVPPGSYRAYVQPLNGPVFPGNLGLGSNQVTASFRTTFAGGNASPSTMTLAAGGAATANISIDPSPPGIQVAFLGKGTVGGQDFSQSSVESLPSGAASDILIWGPGIGTGTAESQLVILGPGLKLRSGSLKTQPLFTINGFVPIRFTVDVTALGALGYASVGVVSGTDAAIWTGGLLLLPNTTNPSFPANGVVNAASFAQGALVPGELFTIFGSGLGPSTIAYSVVNAAGRVATTVGGTRVYFDDLPAAMIYSVNGQVAGMVPYAVAGNASTSVRVEYNGVTSPAVTVALGAGGAPGIFSVNSSGKGPGAILNQDYSANTASNPATIGSVIQIYATGEGQTSPAGVDGLLAASGLDQGNVTATVGGKAAAVAYAGAAPGFAAGLMQVNVVVPNGIATGSSIAVTISVGGVASQSGLTVAIK